MIYTKGDMQRYGDSVAAAARTALNDLVTNIDAQIALNPDPEAIERCLRLTTGRFRTALNEHLRKLQATL